ncbi:hypothetical protein F4819DRAFT_54683 [Hypoxylon fuscum]|nr:hypothetical protein F4819DRAFT_54683 [Hypoxylon fuscum]
MAVRHHHSWSSRLFSSGKYCFITLFSVTLFFSSPPPFIQEVVIVTLSCLILYKSTLLFQNSLVARLSSSPSQSG